MTPKRHFEINWPLEDMFRIIFWKLFRSLVYVDVLCTIPNNWSLSLMPFNLQIYFFQCPILLLYKRNESIQYDLRQYEQNVLFVLLWSFVSWTHCFKFMLQKTLTFINEASNEVQKPLTFITEICYKRHPLFLTRTSNQITNATNFYNRDNLVAGNIDSDF